MSDTLPLAVLAFRRLQGRIAVAADHGPPGGVAANGDVPDPTVLTGGDPVALGRVLRRALEQTWLTLELLFAQEAVGPRLGRGGKETLDAIFANPCFDHLTATPAPFRPTVWRELHAARTAGPLAAGDVEVEALQRQLAGLSSPADPRAAQDLEWFALWQLAADLGRAGFRELRSLFEARAQGGEPLLVGLVTSFVPFGLGLEGTPPRADLGLSLLPAEHVRWLCEHSEPVEVLLNEAYGGPRTGGAAAEVAARLRQGQLFAQQGEYERAVVEYTAAVQADLTSAAPYAHRGDAFRLRGEYERAIADYTQALRLDPGHLLARLNRGLVYRLTGRAEQAVADLTEAVRLDPRNVAALNGRGGAYADLGRYDLAIADHTQALRLDPSLAWAYQSRGDAYAGRGEYDRAITDYTQALRLNPHFPLAHANRGNAYKLAGDLDRAAADFTEALRLDPLNPRIYTSRGDTYRKQGRYDQALADFGEAIRLDPTNPAGYLNRGITYQLAGDFDHAVANFNLAEQFDAGNPALFYQRALAYQSQASFEAAIEDLTRVIELNPRDAMAFVGRGNLFAQTRAFDRAVDDFTEAVRLDPTSAQARLERARVHALRGTFGAALSDCAEALRIDPHLVPAILVRGGVLLRMGEFAKALEEFNQAIAANPRYARAFNDRGVVYTKLGNLEEAVRDFTRALVLDPENPQALANRGNAYLLQQRPADALKDFTQAVVLDAKYAASYCAARGLAEAGRGAFRQALADYAVALALDPQHKLARTAQAEAQTHAATDFDIALPDAPAPSPEATAAEVLHAESAPQTEGSTEIVALAEGGTVELGDPEVLAMSDQDAPTEVHGSVVPSRGQSADTAEIEAVTDEQARYQEEQRRFREAEEAARLKALAEKAAELRRKNELEEAKRKAAEGKNAKKQPKNKRDPEEEAERRKKIKRQVVFTVAGVMLLYYVGPLLWGLVPRKKDPSYTEMPAEKLIEAYVNDPIRADEKYADKTLVVRGKVEVVRGPAPRPGQPGPVLKVFITAPNQDRLKIQCVFDEQGDADPNLKDGEYRVRGVIHTYEAGKPISLLYPAFLDAAPGDKKAAAGANGALARAVSDADRPTGNRPSRPWSGPHGTFIPPSSPLPALWLDSSRPLSPRVRGMSVSMYSPV